MQILNLGFAVDLGVYVYITLTLCYKFLWIKIVSNINRLIGQNHSKVYHKSRDDFNWWFENIATSMWNFTTMSIKRETGKSHITPNLDTVSLFQRTNWKRELTV